MNNFFPDANILIDSLTQGGAEKVAINVSKALDAKSVNNQIVSMCNIDFYQSDVKKVFLSTHNNVSPIKKIILLYKFFNESPATILSFSLDLSFYCVLLKKLGLIKNKIICRFINNPTKEVSTGKFSRIKKRLLFFVLKKSDVILCQSDSMLETLLLKFNFPKERLVRIYNPVYKASNLTCKIRNDNILRLLFVGRLSKQKNLQHIILIANELKLRDIKFIFTIIGDGEEKEMLKNLISINDLSRNVILLGSKNNIAKYYLWADATILTSHYEGLPNVLLESISHGTPCVSYNCKSGPTEIIKEGVNGFIIPIYDYKLLAQTLNIKTLRKLKSNSLYNSIADFHVNTVIECYISLIKKV
ncbi:glycosyltransferase [Providencia zhijiangensis]|uniref:Glycosyltransferase n=1 Tax=Providencia zhijiangensis TaxID=3053982 RepID=A0ABZ0N161_9GAMM|nr:glycosyltransferase [Providencia sp. D4759]WPA92126.1 glycosyltransferase [Providencia sp. D4759]